LQCVSAHEVRPAYLELIQKNSDTYNILWKVPGLGENLHLGLDMTLPARTVNLTQPHGMMVNNSYTERWQIKCSGGLNGDTIRVDGLSGTATDVLVRLVRLNGSVQIARITPSLPYFVISATVQPMEVVQTYSLLGIEHILSGIDHLLFVLALLVITRGGWKLVKTITAFTVSHSISLSLATLGYVHIPQKPVEAIIALSIVFVATEILRERQGKQGITVKAPWVVAFVFGLMHGLGFAGGLSEAGLPDGHIPTALLFFSIGVEAGHFIFVCLALLFLGLAKRLTSKLPTVSRQRLSFIRVLPAYFIGSVAMFWVIDRIAAF
jgi:hydrogenase/urease accessory protein HupE